MDINSGLGVIFAIVLIAAPILFAVSVYQAPVTALIASGILAMYGGAISAGFLPMFGLVVSVGLFVVGVLLVALAGALNATLAALERSRTTTPLAVADEIDSILSERARARQAVSQ